MGFKDFEPCYGCWCCCCCWVLGFADRRLVCFYCGCAAVNTNPCQSSLGSGLACWGWRHYILEVQISQQLGILLGQLGAQGLDLLPVLGQKAEYLEPFYALLGHGGAERAQPNVSKTAMPFTALSTSLKMVSQKCWHRPLPYLLKDFLAGSFDFINQHPTVCIIPRSERYEFNPTVYSTSQRDNAPSIKVSVSFKYR